MGVVGQVSQDLLGAAKRALQIDTPVLFIEGSNALERGDSGPAQLLRQSAQALVAALTEMYIQGPSTRKVKTISEQRLHRALVLQKLLVESTDRTRAKTVSAELSRWKTALGGPEE